MEIEGVNFATVAYVHQMPVLQYDKSCNVFKSKRRTAERQDAWLAKKSKSPVLEPVPAGDCGGGGGAAFDFSGSESSARMVWNNQPVLMLDKDDAGFIPALDHLLSGDGMLPNPLVPPPALPPLSDAVLPQQALCDPPTWARPSLSESTAEWSPSSDSTFYQSFEWPDVWDPTPTHLETQVQNLRLSEDLVVFWKDLADFLVGKMVPVLPTLPTQGWHDYIRYLWQPQGEPDDDQLEGFARGDFPFRNLLSPAATAPVQLSVSAAEANVLPEGWYCLWDDMSALRRWQCFFSVRDRVEAELQNAEPFLPAWSFQFLLVALFRGSALLRKSAQELLQRLPDLPRWHDEYVFAGGFLRRELVNYLRAGRVVPTPVFQTLVRMWPQTHAVAFYEQVENWHTDHQVLEPVFSELQACQPPDFDQPQFKLQSHLLAGVDRVQGDAVFFRYHGCPRSLPKKLASLKNPRLLALLDQWRKQQQQSSPLVQ